MNALDTFMLVIFPYVATTAFVVGLAYRYFYNGFKVSSLSSQFLEGQRLFWGVVPFHIGILVVFFGHLTAFLLPGTTLAWNAHPLRLIILEVSAFIFGLSVFMSLILLIHRRLTHRRVSVVTTRMDLVTKSLLLAQVGLGCWIAVSYRWGSSWFAADLTPYLWSLLRLSPETTAVFALPLEIKLHIFGAFLILLMVPFTRLVHFIVIPLHYLARPYQQVIWNWNREAVRDPATAWSKARPKNN